jgi:hypothetical protein
MQDCAYLYIGLEETRFYGTQASPYRRSFESESMNRIGWVLSNNLTAGNDPFTLRRRIHEGRRERPRSRFRVVVGQCRRVISRTIHSANLSALNLEILLESPLLDET